MLARKSQLSGSFKAELEQTKINFQISSSSIYNKRMEFIFELYQKFESLAGYTKKEIFSNTSERNRVEYRENYLKRDKEVRSIYLPNKLFLSKGLAQKIDDFLNELWDLSSDNIQNEKQFERFERVEKRSGKSDMEKREELVNIEYDHKHKMVDRIAEILDEIQFEFRTLMGIKRSSPTNNLSQLSSNSSLPRTVIINLQLP